MEPALLPSLFVCQAISFDLGNKFLYGGFVFDSQMPPPPSPRDKYSPAREGDSLGVLSEVRSKLAGLYQYIFSYRPTFILDGEGRRWDLLAKPAGKGEVAGAGSPFKVLTRPKPDSTTGAVQAGVIYWSGLYKSLRPDDNMTITGLLSEDGTTGWFDLDPTDAIWLKVTFNTSGVPTAANIESWGTSKEFEIDLYAWVENSYCEDDGEATPTHKYSRKLIAYSVPDDNGKPKLTQVMSHDQILRNVCIDGRPARYPFDHEGGYPL